MGTSKFGGKYGSICGQIWVPDHDSQFAPLRAEITLLETAGGCPNPVLSKHFWTTLHNHKPKYAIEQKKRPLRVKLKMHKKNVHTVFQVYDIHILETWEYNEIHQFFWGHTVFQVYDIHILETWEYMRYISFFGGIRFSRYMIYTY